MALQVIGAGFGRTGTLSLKQALERLGFPCYHMVEVIKTPGAPGLWLAAGRTGTADWDAIFAGFTATVDFPACLFYRELAAHYPDAKVILSTRDPESWFASTQETIFSRNTLPALASIPDAAAMIETTLYQRGFAGGQNDHDRCIAAYEAHNAAVRRDIPASRLLDFQAAQGWEPLCRFLGVPVPAEPFPRANSREDFGAMSEKLVAAAPR